MKKINFQKGISLVETIVYVAIFSIFVIGLAQFSSTLHSTRLQSQEKLEVNGQGTQAIALMTQMLRNASALSVPQAGSSASSLSLTTTMPIVFSESDGVLYITEDGGSPIALTNDKVTLSNLIFSNLTTSGAPNIIQIRFTLAGKNYTKEFYGTATLRK
jgi:type II secretory pathway pseudopilin PulG